MYAVLRPRCGIAFFARDETLNDGKEIVAELQPGVLKMMYSHIIFFFFSPRFVEQHSENGSIFPFLNQNFLS